MKFPFTSNFAGAYIIFKEPISMGGEIFISECATGRIYATKIDSKAAPYDASPDSALLIVAAPMADMTRYDAQEPAAGPPVLYRWNGAKLISVEDTIWPRKSKE